VRTVEIAIIGAGPAGCAAAVQCKRLEVAPLLIDSTGAPGGLVFNARRIDNYPGIEPTKGSRFAKLLEEHLSRFRVSIEKGTAQSISPCGKTLTVEGDFETIEAKSVIVAVGTVPKTIHLETGPRARGRVFFEVHAMLCGLTPSQIIIIGGGEAALDYALSCGDRHIRSTLLVRGTKLKARGMLVDLALKNPFVDILYNARAISVKPDDNGVQVEVSHLGTTWMREVCAVLVAVGRATAAQNLVLGLDLNGFETVSTQIPGLFVAGDARTGSLGQVGMAVGDGLNAAMIAVETLGIGK
jgi:thioredoxin reductase (NADPH)